MVKLALGAAGFRLDFRWFGESAVAELIDELPVTLADHHRRGAARLHHEGTSDGLVPGLAVFQHGQHAETFGTGTGWQRFAADVGEGRATAMRSSSGRFQ